MAAQVEVHMNPVGLAELLKSPGGIIGREIQRRTILVHGRARELCPIDTGRLRSSIRWSFASDSQGMFGLVSSDVYYAGYVNDGTRRMEGRHFLDEALVAAGGS